MSVVPRFALLAVAGYAPLCSATGLNFWESSTTNSALASANGAYAMDASILATAPSSMTQIERTTVTGNVLRYQVDTDYDILGTLADYSKADPIPAGFMVMPINHRWYAGLAIYSRTAADISIPEFKMDPLPIPILYETRVRPVVVSFAPSVAFKWDNFSVAATLEYQYAEYILEQDKCRPFLGCAEDIHDQTSGWGGAISATWQISDAISLAATHRLESHFDDENIEFDLPSITSTYASWAINNNLVWHASYSLSRWQGKGIYYSDYSDPVGLLKGSQHSKRYATSVQYHLKALTLMAGVSLDEAIDAFGGEDIRYRVGLGYDINRHLRLDLTGFSEDYARKYVRVSDDLKVDVQNSGYGIGLGLTYQL
ncbi:OmpP1/FadL family transporter [Vibrio sp. WXL210]|uniref:OmpP1/FadL family transporter n=1 Tax=Vibrio sp. WXL210 TaxID=3450709 RepID=UPI003EC55BA0